MSIYNTQHKKNTRFQITGYLKKSLNKQQNNKKILSTISFYLFLRKQISNFIIKYSKKLEKIEKKNKKNLVHFLSFILAHFFVISFDTSFFERLLDRLSLFLMSFNF